MLPGFRFLFAAIVLSISMLIFGLGAAALLRAAHEEFASIPSRRPPPETMFAQWSDSGAVLAMLRAEPTAAENSSPSEAPRPETAAPEIPIQVEISSAQADDTPAAAAGAKVAAIVEMTPTAPEPAAVVAPDQASALIDDSTRIAETRIATFGGPPVTIETQMPSKIAPAVVKKSSQARRVIKRRRIAPARVTQQAPQTPADPFARPFGR
jgi:hypothetical protein